MFLPSRRYAFIRSRQLEGTYPGDRNEGVWQITHNRIRAGWGQVSESEWHYFRDNDFLAPEPPGLDRSAKRRRAHHYQRIRNSSEARKILERKSKIDSALSRGRLPAQVGYPIEVKVSFEITQGFFDAPHGLISPPWPESSIIGAHAVPLLGYSRAQKWFEFINLWGPEWGDHGRGYMPLEFFDEWMIDSWCTDQSPLSLPETPGIHELQWDVPDPLGDRLYGLEIYDADADERIGWSFAVHRGGHFDIEEFFVKPACRRRGYGARLAEMLVELSEKVGLPLRAWIPFADCEEANRPALASILSRLMLNPRRSGVRWAAFRASPSKRHAIVFDPVDAPPRPAYARSASAITRPAIGSPGYSNEITSYDGALTEEAMVEIADALFCALDAEEELDVPT